MVSLCDISYLIPSYNHGKYIIAALDSIKADIIDSGLMAELIITDDGSQDDSVELIEQWIKNNGEINCYLIIQENSGISKTLNKLCSLASGRYIRLCASDDIIVKGSTQHLMRLLNDNNDALCSFGDGLVINNDGLQIHKSSISYHGANPQNLANTECLPAYLLNNWCPAGPCFLIKKSFYDEYKYDEDSHIEDIDFFLSLFKIKNSIVYLNEKVCMYRIHGANTSKTTSKGKRISNLMSFLGLIERSLVDPDLQYLESSLLSLAFKTRAKIAFLESKPLLVLKNYLLFLLYHFFFEGQS